MTTDIKIAIMKVGVTPSNFDPKYNGCVTRVSRHQVGLYDTDEPMVMCVFKNDDNATSYSIISLTLSELKGLYAGFDSVTDTNCFHFSWDETYHESNEAFFTEGSVSEQA